MTDIDKEREAFEAWYAPRFAGGHVANMPRRANGEYHYAQAEIAWQSYLAALAAIPPAPAAKIKCMDCNLNYDDYPMDIVLSKDQWLMIHPVDGGVLCANCLVARASKLPGVVNLTARITFGRDYDGNRPPSAERDHFNDAVDMVEPAPAVQAVGEPVDIVQQSKELWLEALSQAAFYVRDHCQHGEYHAEAIASMPMPKIYATPAAQVPPSAEPAKGGVQ